MESYVYRDIVSKIEKIEKAIKRLEMDGFLIDKKEFRNAVLITSKATNKDNINYMEVKILLNDIAKHLDRLEKIDDCYKWIKFRINTDGNIKLFIDAYVRDMLEVIAIMNDEIREYGFGYLQKFVTKFYNLVYFLIKLEIGLNGESEIYKKLFNHGSHFYCLNQLMVSDINRTFEDASCRQEMKDALNKKNYVDSNQIIEKLANRDMKVNKMINMNNKTGIKKIHKKWD